jgi:hypothetical protein
MQGCLLKSVMVLQLVILVPRWWRMSGTNFVPLHWLTYWYNYQHRKMIKITISLPSGLTGCGTACTLSQKNQLVVSTCGTYLKLRLQWPSVLYNMCTIGFAWAPDKKLQFNCKGRMMYDIETTIKNLHKSVGVTSYGNMYGDARFNLDFEVVRELYTHKVTQDENYGTILQVIVVEAKKDEDDRAHDMDVLRVTAIQPTSSGFDLTTLTQKKNANNLLLKLMDIL